MMGRVHATRARHDARFWREQGTPLPLANFASALIESRLDKPTTWRPLVRPDARLTRDYDPDRAVLPLMAPVHVLDRIDEIVAERVDWTRVGVVTALIVAGLDRLDADHKARAGGDGRAARRVDRFFATVRPDTRYLTAAERAELDGTR
ncbi:hypothetical protein [Knoellia sp. LjRoot47]|uniref:hypothetical protein n=1 Tax=Knoellia sp. LjRoot47 TaxID=3342330 RepID=UPI003F4FEB9B